MEENMSNDIVENTNDESSFFFKEITDNQVALKQQGSGYNSNDDS